MASVRHLSTYPLEYFTIMSDAAKAPRSIECASKKEAMNLRAQLYAFRTSLLRVAANPACDAELRAIAHTTNTLSFRIRGSTLHVLHPNHPTIHLLSSAKETPTP